MAEKLEARGGIEPPIKALQALALPLGDRAFETRKMNADSAGKKQRQTKSSSFLLKT